MMRLVILMLLLPVICMSQDLGKIQGLNARHFQLKLKKDAIDFLVINDELQKQKPVLIYCQGSHPLPLIITDEDGSKSLPAMSAFDYTQIAKDFHLIMISMPNTPIDVDIKRLNKRYLVVEDTARADSYTSGFQEGNYFENYVDRVKKVVNYIAKQRWVDRNKITLLGHSQGAKIAIQAALDNKQIYRVGFLSGNPNGRIDQELRNERNAAMLGNKADGAAQAVIDGYYKIWEGVTKNPLRKEVTHDFSNRNWVSFEKPMLPTFLKLKIPIYVAYGTRDYKAIMCDMLPIEFITAGKKNLTIKAYVGLEHNFREVDQAGKPNDEKMHWQEVIDAFVSWAKL